MKILHVTDASSAGVLTSVTTLARAQSNSSLFNGVAFAYVRREGSPPKEEIQRRAGRLVSVYEWSSSSGKARFPALVHHLSSALRSDSYDVVHLHSSRAGFLGRLTARLVGRSHDTVYSPHCFAFAQTGLSRTRRTAYLLLERAAVSWGQKVLVVSESEGSLARASLPGVATAVLPNAVDAALLREFACWVRSTVHGPPVPPAARRLRVVHIGRIVEQKRPDYFAAAMAIVHDRVRPRPGLEVEGIWLGDGDRSLLGDAGERIQVSGWLSPERLRARLADSDVVMFTSRGEGMPVSILEAQGLGIPVVASKVNGVVDLVEHGITGFLGTSPDELAGYVCRLLDDDGLRARIREASQEYCARFFDVETLAERSMGAYRALNLGCRGTL